MAFDLNPSLSVPDYFEDVKGHPVGNITAGLRVVDPNCASGKNSAFADSSHPLWLYGLETMRRVHDANLTLGWYGGRRPGGKMGVR